MLFVKMTDSGLWARFTNMIRTAAMTPNRPPSRYVRPTILWCLNACVYCPKVERAQQQHDGSADGVEVQQAKMTRVSGHIGE